MGSGEAVGTSEEEDEPPGARYGVKGAAATPASRPWGRATRGTVDPEPLMGCPVLAELQQQHWDAADEIHRSLMVDHVNEVSQWMVGVKRLIAETRALPTGEKDDSADIEPRALPTGEKDGSADTEPATEPEQEGP